MAIIRQESLFGIQELYDLEPTQRYDAVLSTIDLDLIYSKVSKKSWLGAPTELNYGAMINSVIIRIIERIPTVKDLIKRLNDDFVFKLNCGFLLSDKTPSASAYSRLTTILKETNILEKANEAVVCQAISEEFITDDAVAIDATHFEARDQAPPKEEKTDSKPKKRGRKTKSEREQWLIEQAEREANLPIFEKKIEDQLNVTLDELRANIPQDPQWGVKKNSEGKNVFWMDIKPI